jgi:hypothetical protein
MLEEPRQLAVHLVGVMLVKVQNLLARLAVKVGIFADVPVEALKIVIAEPLRELEHLRIDLANLLHPHFENLVSRQIGRGFLANVETCNAMRRLQDKEPLARCLLARGDDPARMYEASCFLADSTLSSPFTPCIGVSIALGLTPFTRILFTSSVAALIGGNNLVAR